jgi:hypothetical protein
LIGDGKTQAPGICVLRRCSAALKLCGDPFCAVDIGVLDFVEAIYDRISVSQWRAERDNDTGSNNSLVDYPFVRGSSFVREPQTRSSRAVNYKRFVSSNVSPAD